MILYHLPFRKSSIKIIPLLRNYPVRKAILFGSYAKGNASENSDINLYIDTNGKLKGLGFVGLLEILSDSLGKDIDLIDKAHIEPDSLMTGVTGVTGTGLLTTSNV